jgi:hypothetical protein
MFESDAGLTSASLCHNSYRNKHSTPNEYHPGG